jgi:hypothetical protein
MKCAFCKYEMDYVHGELVCINNHCPMKGVAQDDCCSGETMETSPVSTSEIAATPFALDLEGHPVPVNKKN